MIEEDGRMESVSVVDAAARRGLGSFVRSAKPDSSTFESIMLSIILEIPLNQRGFKRLFN